MRDARQTTDVGHHRCPRRACARRVVVRIHETHLLPEPGAMILLRVSANKGNDSLRACVDRMAVRSLVEELRLNPKEEQ
jgi:hypothetical protein